MQYVLYVVTNDFYHNHWISNFHDEFKEVLSVVIVFSFICTSFVKEKLIFFFFLRVGSHTHTHYFSYSVMQILLFEKKFEIDQGQFCFVSGMIAN